jgi:hypothetical protein
MCVSCYSPVNRKAFLSGVAAAAAAPLAAAASPASDGAPKALELGVASMQRIAPTVWVSQIGERVWLHTTTMRLPGIGFYPANGLVIEDADGSLLVDTGYESAQTQALLNYWEKTRRRTISSHMPRARIEELKRAERLRRELQARERTRCGLPGLDRESDRQRISHNRNPARAQCGNAAEPIVVKMRYDRASDWAHTRELALRAV